MQHLDTIKPLLTDFEDNDFISLKSLMEKQIQSNRVDLNKSITEGNTENIDLFINKVSFDTAYLKTIRQSVVPHIKSLHYLATKQLPEHKFPLEDFDVIDTFYLLFKDILDLGEKKDFTFNIRKEKDKLKFNLSDVLFASLFHRLKVDFEFSCEQPFPKYLFIKPLLIKEPAVWEKTLNNFITYSLAKINYQDNSLFISELLKLGFKEQLFQQAKNTENYYYLKSIVKIDNLYTDDFMLSGLSKYHLPMVQEAFQNGIPFFRDDSELTQAKKSEYKNVFSAVFASKDSLDIQSLIVKNIPDISVGNHIIAKTLLHKLEEKSETDFSRNDTRLELIHGVVTRYEELSAERIQHFQQMIEKREHSYAKTVFTKFLDFHNLNQKIPLKENSHLIKKNKI